MLCRGAIALAPSPYGTAHAVLAAGLVGKLRRHEVRDGAPGGARPPVRQHSGEFPGVDAFSEALAQRDVTAVRAALAVWPGPDDEAQGRRALASLVRWCALEARGGNPTHAAQAASTAHAVWALAEQNPGWSALAARALARVLLEDAPQGLARVAATATAVVAKGRTVEE